MAKATVYNQQGEKTGEVELSSEVFGIKVNPGLVQQVIRAELSNVRNTVAHTKNRGEVSGSGKKPWRQKGTGRARAGSIRSPLWKGGGVTFGPRSDRNFSRKINRAQFRQSVAMVLSDKLSSDSLVVLDGIVLEKISTKAFSALLSVLQKKLNIGKSGNILIAQEDKNLEKSCRNLPGFSVLRPSRISPRTLLTGKTTIILKDSLPIIEKRLRGK